MNLELAGKRAVVTGSTVGIGYAIAEALYREGASVVVNGRAEARVAEAVARLKDTRAAAGAGVEGLVADVATAEGAARLLGRFPEIDILVNNMGIYEAKSVEAIDDSDWERLFTVNVVSGARLSQRYLPSMKRRGWGRILFIASESGVNIPPDMIPYGVSKAAQIALARGLAETTAGTGVTVNSVLPGPTLSEGVRTFLDSIPELRSGDREAAERDFILRMRPSSLLKRFARPEEVASLVAYLSSPLASATNGAAVRVEGGLLRGVL